MELVLTILIGTVLLVNGFSTQTPLKECGSQLESCLDEYYKHRQSLISEADEMRYSPNLASLSTNELLAQSYINKLSEDLTKGGYFFLDEFYTGKSKVESSPLHELFKSMPKGGNLHLHSSTVFSLEVIFELTQEPYCYYDRENNRILAVPDRSKVGEHMIRCTQLKNELGPVSFRKFIEDGLVLMSHELDSKIQSKIWSTFQEQFNFARNLIYYHRCFRKILLDFFERSYNDKVYIVELRNSISRMVKDDMTVMTLDEEFQFLSDLVNEFKDTHPDFEVKFIAQSMKFNMDNLVKTFENYKYLEQKYSDLIVAFDTVGEEDISLPISDLVPMLLDGNHNYILHSGETESRYNLNMYDALLLNPKRIGHALSLFNHPTLVNYVKSHGIAIELCPLANHVLGYVYDLRWHPGRSLIAQGIDCTLNNDGPGYWGVTDLSIEFLYAYVAWELDLKDVKKLAINSITYSSLDEFTKRKHLHKFYEDWEEFINKIVVT